MANSFEVRETIPQTASTGPAPTPMIRVNEGDLDDAAPSREFLLQRAAELGPARMTYLTLTPNDPILGAKMQPRVAERRARFRKVVKVALGVCLACCLIATGASALSSSSSPSSPAASSELAKSTRAASVVPVEKLDQPKRGKAQAHVYAFHGATPRFKHR